VTHATVTVLFIVTIVYAYIGFLCLLVLHVAEEKKPREERTNWLARTAVLTLWLPLFVFGVFYSLMKRRSGNA
jgi:formate-dependent nitrite reductase membrane component NrfD